MVLKIHTTAGLHTEILPWANLGTCFRGNEKDLRDRNDTTVLVYTKLFRQICIEGYRRYKVYRGQKRAFALSVSSTKLFLKRNKMERKEKKG